MSMSTNIADLPGPTPEEYEQQYEPQHEEPQHNYQEEEQPIRMNIKKVGEMENFDSPSFIGILTKEVTEENLLILAILILATTKQADEYTRRLLSMFSFSMYTSNFTMSVIKCILLLLLFIIFKNYVLPHLKV